MGNHNFDQIFLILSFVIILPHTCNSLSYNSLSFLRFALPFSSKQSTDIYETSAESASLPTGVAEFSMKPLSSHKGLEKYEAAKRKMVSSNTCWHTAYQSLFTGCDKLTEETKSRLAWHLSDCFQKDSGRNPFPYCDSGSSMLNCLKKLDSDAHKVYLEYYLETNSICLQLQADTFRRQTEILVTELKSSAEFAEEKLRTIEEQADNLMQSSNHIHDYLASIDSQTQEVAQTSKDVQERVSVVLKQTESVYEQSLGIAESQTELGKGQEKMKDKIEEGMTMLKNSYQNLHHEINNLQVEAVEIENTIIGIRDEMSEKMETIQIKAEDIGNMTGVSIDNQKKLLDSQSLALEGLQLLTTFQSRALEESRGTLQQLAELGRRQQEELLERQEQLERGHDHLVENSKIILAAQEAFEKKQASMFLALDKLFALHNDILLESRSIKAFILYTISMFILYMFTSTKQTYNVRPRLYIGLCAAFFIEIAILRYATNDIGQQAWIISHVRLLFLVLASFQILYAIYTYRDYEVLNHQMLSTILEKVMNRELPWEMNSGDDMNSEDDWCSWVEAELPEDVSLLEDPDYMLPMDIPEDSGSSSTTRKYNLRSRRHILCT